MTWYLLIVVYSVGAQGGVALEKVPMGNYEETCVAAQKRIKAEETNVYKSLYTYCVKGVK